MGDEWETPHEFFNGVQERFGIFNLDVCATNETAKCSTYYTQKDDGLIQDWEGMCWCNPPYSKQKPWIEKAIKEVSLNSHNEVMMLIPMNPETNYIHGLVLCEETTKAIYMIHGRLSFLQDGKKIGSPKFGSCLVHFKKPDLSYNGVEFYVCDRNFDNIIKVSL